MSHVWIKDEKYKPSAITRHLSFTEKHVCSVCNCERFKCEGKRYTSFSYIRSGIVFTPSTDNVLSDGSPICIDWEAEKRSTID